MMLDCCRPLQGLLARFLIRCAFSVENDQAVHRSKGRRTGSVQRGLSVFQYQAYGDESSKEGGTMDKEEIARADQNHMLHVGLAELGVVFVEGEGTIIKDIDSRLGAYHGGTFGAKTATCLVMSKPPWVESLVPGFVHIPMPYCYRCSFG